MTKTYTLIDKNYSYDKRNIKVKIRETQPVSANEFVVTEDKIDRTITVLQDKINKLQEEIAINEEFKTQVMAKANESTFIEPLPRDN